MQVIVVEPKKKPMVQDIDSDLKSMQKIVGGSIQAIYPFDEPVALICNEEGKLLNLPLNRALRDDEAVVNMVDANLQRETILPSERAFAYKMKLAAMSHQGRKGFTSAQLGRKCVGKESRELIAEQVGQSRNQISRYIRLTELIPEILEMVDNRKMALNPAVSISYGNRP